MHTFPLPRFRARIWLPKGQGLTADPGWRSADWRQDVAV